MRNAHLLDFEFHLGNYVIRTGDLAMLQVNNSLQLEQDKLMFSSSYSQDGREQFRLSVSRLMSVAIECRRVMSG